MDPIADQIRNDIDATEAALYGDPDTGMAGLADAPPAPETIDAPPDDLPPTGEPEPAPEPPAAPEPEPEPEPEPAATPASESTAPPAPEPQEPETEPDPRAHWTPLERRAVELRERNPDMSLEESYAHASKELGIAPQEDAPPAADAPTEPSLAEQISDIEAKLDEAGANEGLFTKEIADLTKQHARLVAKQALEQSEAAKQAQAEQDSLAAQREASMARLQAFCPESRDPDSKIGQSMSVVIRELAAEGNPLLLRADAPEQIFHLANARLPEAERYEVARKAPAAASAPVPPAPGDPPSAPAPHADPAQPAAITEELPPVATFAPVSGALRSAQPAIVPLAKVPEVLRQTDADTLEKALYGEEDAGFHLRL